MPSADSSPSDSTRAAAPKRSFSFTNLPLIRELVDYVCDCPSKRARTEGGEVKIHRAWSVDDFATISDGLRCPYSSVVKNPGVPYEFQLPLHYPRFTKEQYHCMPEWQLDRLLEEYGLPAGAMGSLDEKREYAIGAFLWKDQLQR